MTIPRWITAIGISDGIPIPIRRSHQCRLSICPKTLILHTFSVAVGRVRGFGTYLYEVGFFLCERFIVISSDGHLIDCSDTREISRCQRFPDCLVGRFLILAL